MNETPRSDEARIKEKNGCITTFQGFTVVPYTFACQLERELAETKNQLNNYMLGFASANEDRERMKADLDAAEQQLETESMRLAACGVVALADTEDSRIEARKIHPDYRSASLGDVERRVDECIRLRKELAEMTENCRYWKQVAEKRTEEMHEDAKLIIQLQQRLKRLVDRAVNLL